MLLERQMRVRARASGGGACVRRQWVEGAGQGIYIYPHSVAARASTVRLDAVKTARAGGWA
jgi:hypothetical protein